VRFLIVQTLQRVVALLVSSPNRSDLKDMIELKEILELELQGIDREAKEKGNE